MIQRTISRFPVALLALMSSAALTWAIKSQLDSRIGPSGLETLIAATEQILLAILANVPIMVFVLTIGLVAGAIISSAARRIDAHHKSKGRWSLPTLKKEVGFSRVLCRRPWLGFLVQDMWEDLDILSHQLVLRGLNPLPPHERGDRSSIRRLYGYLDVIHPLLTDEKLKYATLCGCEYMHNIGDHRLVAASEEPQASLHPTSDRATPEATVGQASPEVRHSVIVRKKPGSGKPREANRRRE